MKHAVSRKALHFATIAVLSTALGLFTACSSQSDPHAVAATSPDGQVEKQIWTCPMHPQVKQDQPGKCPICHMDLVKVQDKNEVTSIDQASMPSGHAAFHLDERRQQMIGVKLGRAEEKEIFKTIEAAGRIAFDPELYTAQSEYIEAIKQMERVRRSPVDEVRHSAERMVESAKLRLKILGLSDRQISQLARKDSTDTSLLIPKAGEETWVYAEVFEMDLPSIQPGLEARVRGPASSGEILHGKVVSVDRVLNPNTRTAKVRIQLQDARGKLRPESYVDVEILSPMGRQVTVPFDAVLDTGKESWVFLSDGKGHFTPRKVDIKFRVGDDVAVRKGLEGGELIVTSANFLIDSESRLRAAAEGVPSTPECPKGQFWHAEMNHCMPELKK